MTMQQTGKSKHYAFIEFASRDVAQIVAETMDNYLLLNHQLKCKLLEPTQVHEELFKGANKKFKVVPWNKIERERHNAPKTETEHKKSVKALLGREQKKRKALEALGIDYTFPGVQAILKPVPEAKEEPARKKAKTAAKKTKKTKVKA
jgi:nucleolar protein 15